MSKHAHHESNQEQRAKKERGAAPFHYEKTPDQTSKSIKSKDVPAKMSVDDVAIRQLAYEIFQEKGGSDLDNWFEAEESLNHNF
jgi:hypothetical protein